MIDNRGSVFYIVFIDLLLLCVGLIGKEVVV